MKKQQLTSIIKRARNIMRKDAGLSTDVDRTPQLSWMLFLKFFDDLEKRNEALNPNNRPVIEKPHRWRDWASNDEGITGDDLIKYVNDKLIPYLRELKGTKENDPRDVLASLFAETYNRMLSGYLFREIINLIDEIDFQSKDDIFTLSHLYESMLKEMRDAAGSSGEFYTPRPVVRFIVEHIKPKLGERVLDPACGTGGFLVEAYEYMKKQAKTAEDYDQLQYKSLFGIEKKPMPYLLGTMNLMLHGIDTPNIQRRNTLSTPLREITEKDKFDLILTNPPFGGEEEKGIQNNFPLSLQTSDTALLFVQYILKILKTGGRCGLVVPNGFLSSTGVAKEIRKLLISECSLNEVVRLPTNVFSPYAPIESNLMFFTKSGTTKNIWYCQIPEPKKSFSKTNPIQNDDLDECRQHINSHGLSKYSWITTEKDLNDSDYNFDIRNGKIDDSLPNISPQSSLNNIEELKKRVLPQLDSFTKLPTYDTRAKLKSYKLGEILKRNTIFEEKEDNIEYIFAGLYSFTNGIFLHPPKFGKDFKTTKLQRLQIGNFVYSKIMAWEGAFGVVQDEAQGSVMTGTFVVYEIDKQKVLPRYLELYFMVESNWKRIGRQSTGTNARRKSLNPDVFESSSISIPDIQTQQKIVDLIYDRFIETQKLCQLLVDELNLSKKIHMKKYLG